ncbi:hypothetical protein CU633_08495 [Bacillus sp. V3-13]|uniref:UvrB/UvrC motif-containing protein n=1 Tax=Bacillus sp. V3-13 TaxID=2053728 RepID=UPI000C76D9E7|nr:UvrB/UvrC motif-containing protein [Bacillus sp. V3-13]PLR77929.1 hypothetical protein CU633_08495 [Bacillus sp. V3-13]
MICEDCNQRPATMHFTKIVNGEKTEVHLCEKCAQEKGDMFMFNSGSGFSINNLLAGLLNVEPAFPQSTKPQYDQDDIVQCENCKMTFPQFAKVGRFGCANCYDTFKEQLKPILRRLHSGNWSHNGKIPKRIGGSIQLRRKLDSLKQNLQELISKEEFEKAAQVRDEIRLVEKSMNEANKGGE